jgi:hypothetical protein
MNGLNDKPDAVLQQNSRLGRHGPIATATLPFQRTGGSGGHDALLSADCRKDFIEYDGGPRRTQALGVQP